MSGYTAMLEDCADSIFNAEKPSVPWLVAQPETIHKAWGLCKLYRELQSRRNSFEGLLRAVNDVLTGDENASFYALGTIFVERTYLVDDSVQSVFQEILNGCIAEEKKYVL